MNLTVQNIDLAQDVPLSVCWVMRSVTHGDGKQMPPGQGPERVQRERSEK